ncbi:hypothetical protein GHT06_011004 [Daphnia sinensis]|uniref:Uncharacterized protein n=1 Tax=Daphnia sinensis TaxID=1820382 RepID=A0AAD5KZC8_9CRUS|nr:hypothetical protein GHT06_011004 [Daphnia sinensis]
MATLRPERGKGYTKRKREGAKSESVALQIQDSVDVWVVWDSSFDQRDRNSSKIRSVRKVGANSDYTFGQRRRLNPEQRGCIALSGSIGSDRGSTTQES